MYCPECRMPMLYHEGEDEGSGDVLVPYAYWFCPTCGHTVRDFEDAFDYLEES